jgi:hypothetical protein
MAAFTAEGHSQLGKWSVCRPRGYKSPLIRLATAKTEIEKSLSREEMAISGWSCTRTFSKASRTAQSFQGAASGCEAALLEK